MLRSRSSKSSAQRPSSARSRSSSSLTPLHRQTLHQASPLRPFSGSQSVRLYDTCWRARTHTHMIVPFPSFPFLQTVHSACLSSFLATPSRCPSLLPSLLYTCPLGSCAGRHPTWTSTTWSSEDLDSEEEEDTQRRNRASGDDKFYLVCVSVRARGHVRVRVYARDGTSRIYLRLFLCLTVRVAELVFTGTC